MDFVSAIAEASPADTEVWEEYCVSSNHGTVVILDECDQISYARPTDLINRLKKHLGQTFRLFIAARSSFSNGAFKSFITINEENVYLVDPLMLDEYKDMIFPRTREKILEFSAVLEDFSIQVPLKADAPDADFDNVRVRIAVLPEAGAIDLGINVSNQGIYVVRNQREIIEAATLGMFSRAQDLNRFRAELYIPASLDKRFGLDWRKNSLILDHDLERILKEKLMGHIRSVRKAYNQRRAARTIVEHSSFEKLIAQKQSLLSLPKGRRSQSAASDSAAFKSKGDNPIVRGGVPQKVRDRAEFAEARMSAAGPLWEPEMKGARIVITFNTDHPFWVRYVLESDRSQAVQSSTLELLHLMSYCLAAAEMKTFDQDEYLERLINMRQQLSNNMRVLLT